MDIPEIIEWLQEISGLSLKDRDAYLIAQEIYNLLEEIEDEVCDSATSLGPSEPVKDVVIPHHLRRDDGFVKITTFEGENWINVDAIGVIRHVSYLEIDLSSGDTLRVDLSGQDITKFLAELKVTLGRTNE